MTPAESNQSPVEAAPQSPVDLNYAGSVETRLDRMESKIDSIGLGSNWLMQKVEAAERIMTAMAQNPMIRQMLPKGMTRG